MKLREKYGTWACVAGAAEGLGKAFAESLAKRGFNLILIDHKADLLKLVKEYLDEAYQLEFKTLLLDLNDTASVKPIMDAVKIHTCRFLIYNAAYGPVKPFLSNSMDEIDRYLNVNIGTQIRLIHHFVDLYQHEHSGILLVSSLAGFTGTQYVIPYAATKAFIWNMAEGLHYEFKNSTIDFGVCCPGPTDTPNFRSTQPKNTPFTPKSRSPQLVTEEALNHFGRRLFIIPGTSNKIAHFLLNRVLPRRIASGLHNMVVKKIYC